MSESNDLSDDCKGLKESVEGNLGANELYKLSSSVEVALMPQLTGAFLLILKYGCHLNADKMQGRTSVAFEAFLYSFCEFRDFLQQVTPSLA